MFNPTSFRQSPKQKQRLYQVAVWLFATALSTSLTTQVLAETGTACILRENSHQELVPHYQLPCDYPENAVKSRAGYYRFAWNTLMAMNWPAAAELSDGSHRGLADANAKYGATDATPVWDTWRGKRELFRPTIASNGKAQWNTNSPGTFAAFPATADPNPDILACNGQQSQEPLDTMQAAKIENFADETDEIGLAVVWSMFDPQTRELSLLPTETSLLRYQVKFNKDHWDYVVNKGIYATDALTKLINDTSESKLGGVSFPAGAMVTQQTGSVLTKSAWRMLSEDEATSKSYYAVDAYYYKTDKSSKSGVCYSSAKFGLVALHVIRKTEAFPTFLFSTFEHKENYSGRYYYANTNGKNKSGMTNSLLTSGYGIAYKDPMDPVAGIPADQVPYVATRLISPSAALVDVNQEAEEVNAGTVWQNYRLVGVQVQPVNGIIGKVNPNPNPNPNQDFFLANPVVETNQRFQYFDGTFTEAGVNNVVTNPTKSATADVNMGGCMGCHGVAQSNATAGLTDFSFTLSNVRQAPAKATAAESLEDKCREIGLSFDKSACTRN